MQWTTLMAIFGLIVGAPLLASPVDAQDPPPVPAVPAPSPDNVTNANPYAAFYAADLEVQGSTFLDFQWIDMGKQLQFRVQDLTEQQYSIPGGPMRVDCEVVNTTAEGNWQVVLPIPCGLLPVGGGKTYPILVSRDLTPGPISASWTVYVNMTSPVEKPIGFLQITARVQEFHGLSLQPSLPSMFSPDQTQQVPITLKNTGNGVGIFEGEATVPEGWQVRLPQYVAVPPNEEVTVNMSVISPRDKMLYLSESALIQVRYTDTENPAMTRAISIPTQVNGMYLHPALTPLIVLAILLVVIFVYFAVLARRAIEESILGKPVPPWRIPEEKAYLKELEKTDPDEFYIVRYYLMVEEHESALLWFKHYKKATKKDRKAESEWFKVKRTQERKVSKREKEHARVGKKWDRKILRVEKKRDRKLRRLEKKLRRKERKKHKKVTKRHDKIVAKVQAKHDKKVAKAMKKHEKLVARETKKVEKENKKRAKRDEGPLPLPDMPAPEFEDPELPTVGELEEVPLKESRYGKRAERLENRAGTKMERLEARKDKLVARDRTKADKEIGKHRSKIPPEPTTHLYDTDEYVPEDEVIVEDDRNVIKKLLHVPTLEEREVERRRRNVYQARLKEAQQEAKETGDDTKVQEVRRTFKEEREARIEARKARLDAARESGKEDKLLAKERKRRLKERQKELKAEAEQEATAPSGEAATVEGPAEVEDLGIRAPEQDEAKAKKGFAARLKVRSKAPAADETTADAAPDDAAAAAEEDGEKTPAGGFAARFRKRPTDEAEEPTEGPAEAVSGDDTESK